MFTSSQSETLDILRFDPSLFSSARVEFPPEKEKSLIFLTRDSEQRESLLRELAAEARQGGLCTHNRAGSSSCLKIASFPYGRLPYDSRIFNRDSGQILNS